MKAKNKGGRPAKSEAQKHTLHINLKLSTVEDLILKNRVRTSGQSRSECVRQLIETGTVQARITPEILDILRKLCGMANNLNQIARKANAAGYRDARSKDLALADRIDNLITELEK